MKTPMNVEIVDFEWLVNAKKLSDSARNRVQGMSLDTRVVGKCTHTTSVCKRTTRYHVGPSTKV